MINMCLPAYVHISISRITDLLYLFFFLELTKAKNAANCEKIVKK